MAAGAIVLAGCMVVVAVAVLHHGCALPAPQADLPPQLRAVGDFGQPYPAGESRGVEEAALLIAASLDRDLLGASADRSVAEAAADSQRHDATVIPLRHLIRGAGSTRVVGLVVFLDDCDGRRYYSSVTDLLPGRDPARLPTGFPSVSMETASPRLGTPRPELAYVSDPTMPVWRNRGTGATVPAFVL